MTASQRLTCLFYGLITVVALVGTGSQLRPYLALGFVQGNAQFWQDTLANAASRFITVDVMCVFAVVWHWMATEGRRLKMRGYGWYFPASLFIAFSVALPVFMIQREMARARQTADAPVSHSGLESLSVVLVSLVATAYAAKSILLAW
jgi:hypothetical protein